MTAFLIDAMFPPATAALLRDTHGHDALHVAEAGLQAAEDAQVAALARGQRRAVVTKNVADFAAERDVALVFVLKRNLPAGGAQAPALAKLLDHWAQDHPTPYLGPAGHQLEATTAISSLPADLAGHRVVSAETARGCERIKLCFELN